MLVHWSCAAAFKRQSWRGVVDTRGREAWPRSAVALLCASLICAVFLGRAPARAEMASDPRTMLALNLYHEARQDGRDGMIAVGWVVLNRIRDPRYPDTVVGVITQGGEQPPCQFGWWCDGRSDRPTEPDGWMLAQEVTEELLGLNPPADPTKGALFFYETWRDTPGWGVQTLERTTIIGGNQFLRVRD